MVKEPKNPLEGVLKNIIGSIGARSQFTQEELAAAWEEAVGKKAAAHSKPKTLKGSRVIVHVDRSGWLYELTVAKKDILKKLSEILKGKKVSDITFRIGDIK